MMNYKGYTIEQNGCEYEVRDAAGQVLNTFTGTSPAMHYIDWKVAQECASNEFHLKEEEEV